MAHFPDPMARQGRIPPTRPTFPTASPPKCPTPYTARPYRPHTALLQQFPTSPLRKCPTGAS